MIFSESKDESNHISCYQDFLYEEGEFGSFVMTLKKFQLASSEKSNPEFTLSLKEPISEIKNNLLYSSNTNDEEEEEQIKQIIDEFVFSSEKEKFINNENENAQEEKNYDKIPNKKEDLSDQRSYIDIRVISSYRFRKIKSKALSKRKKSLKPKKSLSEIKDSCSNICCLKKSLKKNIFNKNLIFKLDLSLYFLLNFFKQKLCIFDKKTSKRKNFIILEKGIEEFYKAQKFINRKKKIENFYLYIRNYVNQFLLKYYQKLIIESNSFNNVNLIRNNFIIIVIKCRCSIKIIKRWQLVDKRRNRKKTKKNKILSLHLFYFI